VVNAIPFQIYSREILVTLTLLLDLDGTLLINDIDAFVAAYVRALAGHMSDHTDPNRLASSLMTATQKMILNLRPDMTLKETFDRDFYPSLEIEESEVRGTIEAFYRDVFPSLKRLTDIRPDALTLLEEAQSRGYKIGIATNPLFPRTAILQRLDWAGVSTREHDISLIPSYETFHFAKPNPAFYAEFLAQMGWPEGPVVMVGNDFEADIVPARQIGLATFYTPENGSSPAPGYDPNHGPAGNLGDLLTWIDSQDPASLQPNFSSPHTLINILRATPAALNSLAKELPPEVWTSCPIPGEWCIAEITCHLRDVDAEVNLPRLKQIIKESNPFLPGMDTDRWVEERDYIAQDCLEALDAFIANRMELLNLLDNLPEEAWKLPARHAIFGPTQFYEMVSIIAGHDRLHLQQVYASMP
jgi:FMN phosphatase YigB (HAD superfamily)